MSQNTPVPLLDTRRANLPVANELREAFDRLLASGRFILGEEVEAFEQACARYLGVEHAIGLSSGTDALLVALMAVGVKAGDEVLCPTYTFFATAGSIWRLGAKPVFVDSRPRCFNIDPEQLAERISPKTRALLPVHLFGQCAEMGPILALAKARGLPVIEDAAQAIGAAYEGRKAGALGTAGCFSFFPSKNLGGFGDGGLVTTHDGALAERVRALRNHGGQKTYEHLEVGGNFRLDALQAALLRVKLDFTDLYGERRQANAAYYTRRLVEAGVAAPAPAAPGCGPRCLSSAQSDAPILLPVACQGRHVFNQYVIRVRDGQRDRLQAHLQGKKIGCAIYYPKPLHLQPCFASLGHRPGDFPVAEALARESLALPIFSELTEAELDCVATAIIEFVGGK